MAWKAGAEMTKVMKGPWQALPFDGVDANVQDLLSFGEQGDEASGVSAIRRVYFNRVRIGAAETGGV
jgi:hypothetical protein